ncbi:hypothetical protein KIN20_028134 [Parelaphostrongylus tenuis]|uniref:Uncharacterized protein n=1 Tax=Parelaphostrongylus tenuis TaxID=148309 RepID=A0AAD5R0B2_PARTN|nr:hypothetical protein KIN20_028134 [Parelaphostrongylus tenuis]
MSSSVSLESFDLTSLCTNVSNDSALQATQVASYKAPRSCHMLDSAIHDTLEGVSELLNLQMVRKYFAQTRGLPMGDRQEPSPAVAFMSK